MQDLNLLKEVSSEISITIKLQDLLEANRQLIEEVREEKRPQDEPSSLDLLTVKQVIDRLKISEATLYRWQKRKYLVPVMVGGTRRYKGKDVARIINERYE